jgi:hypothetical protein
MKEGTTLGARAQSAIERAAVLYKPRLATFNFFFFFALVFSYEHNNTKVVGQSMRSKPFTTWRVVSFILQPFFAPRPQEITPKPLAYKPGTISTAGLKNVKDSRMSGSETDFPVIQSGGWSYRFIN